MPLCFTSLFPHQEAWQITEGRRICRAVLPSLPRVGIEERGLYEKAWEMGEQKTWAGNQESNSSRREQEIRRQNRGKLPVPGKAAIVR